VTVTLSHSREETVEAREARLAIEPFAHDLRRAMTRAQADYFRPVAIRVPLSFPKSLDGGRLWAVPIERADVPEPEVAVQDMDTLWWLR